MKLVHDNYPMFRSSPGSMEAERDWYDTVSNADMIALEAGRSRMDIAMAHLHQAASLGGYESPWEMLDKIRLVDPRHDPSD